MEKLGRENTSIESLIATNPLLLDSKSPEVIKVGEYYLPYSTGFEIECGIKDRATKDDFLDIPDLLHLDINSSEQRFRIKEGITGLKSLRIASDTLIKYALFNKLSGIHYHIDCTDVYDQFTSENVEANQDWMLKELDTWGYTNSYNTRRITFPGGHNWIRFQDGFRTMEFRIGEMAFDYPTLFKRITHANDIVRRFKNNISIHILERYKDDYEDDVKNRVIKL